MSNTEKNTKKSGKKSNPVVDWTIRGVVFGVLGVLLLLALLDYRAKQAAGSTAEGWRSALKSVDESGDLLKSQLEKLPLHGSPTVVNTQAAARSFNNVSSSTYTWKGTFRSYVVKVTYGMGNDPTVEDIKGPGEAQ
jgi:hypothetical protein